MGALKGQMATRAAGSMTTDRTTIDDHPLFFTISISSNTFNINRNNNDNKQTPRTGSTGRIIYQDNIVESSTAVGS